MSALLLGLGFGIFGGLLIGWLLWPYPKRISREHRELLDKIRSGELDTVMIKTEPGKKPTMDQIRKAVMAGKRTQAPIAICHGDMEKGEFH